MVSVHTVQKVSIAKIAACAAESFYEGAMTAHPQEVKDALVGTAFWIARTQADVLDGDIIIRRESKLRELCTVISQHALVSVSGLKCLDLIRYINKWLRILQSKSREIDVSYFMGNCEIVDAIDNDLSDRLEFIKLPNSHLSVFYASYYKNKLIKKSDRAEIALKMANDTMRVRV